MVGVTGEGSAAGYDAGMTRSGRRIVSWVSTLAAGALMLVGAMRLPGARGAEGELRWRLARLASASPRFERDMGLLVAAFADTRLASCAAEARRWLVEAPAELRPRLLHLLWVPVRTAASDAPLREVVLDWVMSLPPAERAALLPGIGELWLAAATGSADRGALLFREVQVDVARLAARLHPDDTAWLALLMSSLAQQAPLEQLGVLRNDAERDELLFRSLAAAGAPLRDSTGRRGRCRLWYIVDLDAERLAALLDDPSADVRYAAGRTLALAGDARGLARYCEFLDAGPRPDPLADAVLGGIYGPDWRSLCESCRATRLPRERDGR